MRLANGARARFTTIDGTTIEGTIRRSWFSWGGWHLSKVQALTASGPQSAAGQFIIPKRAVLFVQVLPDAEAGE